MARHFGKYGSKGVSKAVIISGVPPYLLKTPDNPGGLDASVFDGIEQALQANWNIAAGASAIASLACVQTWHEDFREDLTRIDVPTLVIHGDTDRILPIAATGLRTAKLIKGARLLVVKDGPHCIPCRHAEEVNAELMSFLGGKTGNLKKEVA